MTQLYILMYICVFISFIAARLIDKDIKRPFKVPGGIFGMCLDYLGVSLTAQKHKT